MRKVRNGLFALLITIAMTLSGSAFASPMDTPNAKTDFGAAGDGTTDDTAALQAALDSGALVYLPPGTYKVTGDLTLLSGSGFVGTPETIVRFDGDYKFDALDKSDIWLQGFTIKRNIAANTALQPLIKLYYTHDVVLDSLTLLDSKTTGNTIAIRGSYDSNLEVTDSYNYQITNNTIKDYHRISPGGLGSGSNQGVKGTGIGVLVTRDFVVSGNRVIETQRYFTPGSTLQNFQGAGIAIISSVDGTVTDNVVDYAGQGIDIGGGNNNPARGTSGFRGTARVAVTGNTIKDIYAVGIKLVNGASHNSVSANAIHRSGLVGIWLAPGATAVADQSVIKGNVIYANTVTDTGSGPGKDAWSVPGSKRNTGITIEEAEDTVTRPTGNLIIGNTVMDTKGIMTYGVSDIGVFSSSTPQSSYNNYFMANFSTGAITQNESISSANKNLTW